MLSVNLQCGLASSNKMPFSQRSSDSFPCKTAGDGDISFADFILCRRTFAMLGPMHLCYA